MMVEKTLGGLRGRLFQSEGGAPETLVCLLGGHEEMEDVHARLQPPRPALLALEVPDWNGDLSPWRAAAVFKGGDFTGGAAAFLPRMLLAVDAWEREAGLCPGRRVLAGYSLAGLFAVWAATQTERFDTLACMSGSLWFDGFADWLQGQRVQLTRAYFSLGDQEARTRNMRMARVAECTAQVRACMEEKGVKTYFEWNAGNHFRDVPQRLARGIAWAAEEKV